MNNVLSELSNNLADTVANANAGVVRVAGRRRLAATGIVWNNDGIIVTANHVVRMDEGVQVGLPNGESVAAELVGRDPATDLAVLRIQADGLQPFTEANKQETGVGNLVLALGRPGNSVQATLGIVSALGEGWRTPFGGQIDRYLQTDVVMYPGFSGGPLVNAAGQLVGMNTSGLIGGISIAVPVTTVARVVESLLAHGRVKKGYLGVSTQRAHLPEDVAAELGQKRGLLVVQVEKESPAAAAGLTLGDTIISLAGVKVTDHDSLLAELSGERVGTAVPVQIVRGGSLTELEITIGERPEGAEGGRRRRKGRGHHGGHGGHHGRGPRGMHRQWHRR